MTPALRAATPQAAPRAALRVPRPLRERQLRRAVLAASVGEADVLIVEVAPGETLPPDAAAFDGALLLLSDEPAHAADPTLAGVLPRDADERLVAAAVAALAAGLSVRAPGAREAAGFAPREAPRPLLTPREVEVLALVGEGLSNKAIARRLGISAHTVKYHLEAMFGKLGVRSRAEAVMRGLRLGVHML